MDEILTKLAMHTATFVGKAAFAYSTNYAMTLEATIRMVQPAIDLIEIISARGNTALEPTAAQTTILRKEIESFARSLSEYNLSETKSTSSTDKTDKKKLFNASKVINEMQVLTQKIEKFVPYLNLMMTTSGANLGWSLPNSISTSRLLQASDALREANRLFSKSSKQIRVGPAYKLKLYYMFTASVRPKSVNDFTWKEEFTKCDVALYRVHDIKEDGEKSEYVYELIVVEDLNDGRYHEEFDNDGSAKQLSEEVKLENKSQCIPGKIKRIPVGEISRLYYTSSGSLLNIEDSKSPVLVLKVIKGLSKSHLLKVDDEIARTGNVDLDANPLYVPPNTSEKRVKESKEHSNAELFALEIFQEPIEIDDDEEEEGSLYSEDNDLEEQSTPGTPSPRKIPLPMSPATLTPRKIPLPMSPATPTRRRVPLSTSPLNPTPRRIPLPSSDNEDSDLTVSDVDEEEESVEISDSTKTAGTLDIHDDSENLNTFVSSEDEIHQYNLKTLSLLEYMLRLSALEVCEQTNHLEVADEKINLFLKDDDSTGSSSTSTASTASAAPAITPESSTHRATPRRLISKSLSSSRKLLFKDEIAAVNKMSSLSVNDK
ncbi:RanGTP-binding protein [Gigaspora rosea]|uniref:RanGTP-binding protein n=1 Tax=Gigaspora rosea TaxID=44941 RepID=A0A397W746_9GLOM|nr:RanGTP-binding protein [Gigaspora rosea]